MGYLFFRDLPDIFESLAHLLSSLADYLLFIVKINLISDLLSAVKAE